MSKLLSSDPTEHSTPLSNNKERRWTDKAPVPPLMRPASVLDNADNTDELSAREPSPISPSAQPPSPSSKHARRPFPQQHRKEKDPQLPLSPATLARHGVKVRDFAYESNLPVIPSIPRVRKLVLGRPLKRTKRYFEQPDDVFTLDTRPQSQCAAAGSSRAASLENESVNESRQLERKSTEPVIFPPERESQRPYRDVGYADLSQHPSGSQAAQSRPHYTPTAITPTAMNRTSIVSLASLPFPTKRSTTGGSQESELSTDTPLVTPKGSLTWPTITSDVPASQPDNRSPVLVKDMTTLTTTCSSVSHAPDADTVGSPRPTEVATSPPQPLDLDLDDLDETDDIAHARASSSPSPSPTRLTRVARQQTGDPNAAAPRYFLRKHGSPVQEEQASSPFPHRRRKSSMKAPAPYPARMPPVTRQAAHAAASGSSGRSPRARPLRKATIS